MVKTFSLSLGLTAVTLEISGSSREGTIHLEIPIFIMDGVPTPGVSTPGVPTPSVTTPQEFRKVQSDLASPCHHW